MTAWKIVWKLTSADLLEGLTLEHEGQAELGGHFAPKAVLAYAEEQVRAQAQVTTSDVVRLTITIEKVPAA